MGSNGDDRRVLAALEADLVATDPRYARRMSAAAGRLGGLALPSVGALLRSLGLLLVNAGLLTVGVRLDQPGARVLALLMFPFVLAPCIRSTRPPPTRRGRFRPS